MSEEQNDAKVYALISAVIKLTSYGTANWFDFDEILGQNFSNNYAPRKNIRRINILPIKTGLLVISKITEQVTK